MAVLSQAPASCSRHRSFAWIAAGVLATAFLGLAAPGALAAPIAVDFSTLPTTMDIVYPNTVTLNTVTMYFDPQGNPGQYAAVDSGGIYGSTNGLLVLTVTDPIIRMNIDWSVENVSGPVLDGIYFATETADPPVIFPGTYLPYNPAVPDVGHVVGNLAYEGTPFTVGQIYFSLGTPPLDPVFFVNAISVDAVPEPVSVAILACGAGGLLLRRKKRVPHVCRGV